MKPCPYPATSPKTGPAFTLLELLVVVAIIAVVGSAVAVTYGRKNVDDAKDKMTLHDMQEIKKAFLRFQFDNGSRLKQAFADHEGTLLPSAGFLADFQTDHPEDPALEARMEFFETYGLWFLMRPTIYDVDAADRDSGEIYRFPDFGAYDRIAGEGWNGPYLDGDTNKAWVIGGARFPQIGGKHGLATVDADGNPLGVYRLLYYEHQEDDDQPYYRRLLLVSPRDNASWDTLAELLPQTGNLRGGTDQGRLNLDTGAFENLVADGDDDDGVSPFFVLELLNMDRRPDLP